MYELIQVVQYNVASVTRHTDKNMLRTISNFDQTQLALSYRQLVYNGLLDMQLLNNACKCNTRPYTGVCVLTCGVLFQEYVKEVFSWY